jgi:Skp family chaperone for outer membrane proteins
MTRRLLGSALALLFLGGVFLSGARADLKIGTIDMGKVTNGYTALQDKSRDLQAWHDKKAEYLQKLDDFRLLSDENFAQVIVLLNTAPPLPADKAKQLQDLSDEAAAKERRLHDLEGKAPRTTAEDEEFKTLEDQYANGQKRHDNEEAKLTADYERQLGEARDGFMKQVQKVAAALAQAQGYNLVLDAGFVLVGGDDLTQQVLDKLNAK